MLNSNFLTHYSALNRLAGRSNRVAIAASPDVVVWEVHKVGGGKREQTSSPKGNDRSPESQQVIKIF